MSFKLLAIRPLDKCNPKFLKNLEENRIYKFYNDYIFQDSKGNEIIDFSQLIEVSNIKYESTAPINLYGDKINISAIVGKNGTGKSALVELFVASINQLSYSLLNYDEKRQLKTSADIKEIDIDENGKTIQCQIFYEYKNEYYYLQINHLTFSLYQIPNSVEFKLDNFFYSMIINYSLYAFNSSTIGDWIDELFHKNDSYQIPVVINPKREHKENGLSGIIDINNEQYLLQQRLLVNILKPVINENFSLRKMGNNGLAVKLEIKRIKEKEFKAVDTSPSQIYTPPDTDYNVKIKLLEKDNYGILFNQNVIHNPLEILEKTKEKFNIQGVVIPNQKHFDIYIIYKIISICFKYESYRKFVVNKNIDNHSVKFVNILDFLDYIEEYPSHIAYKLKQTVNFIKYYSILWNDYGINSQIDIDALSEKLNSFSDKNNIPLIEILPPPLFETNILIENSNKHDLIEFNSLSSGEQQLIHSISSVIYHLNNINSVKKDEIVKYQCVNIIFEEIELYFHPEFQKKFVNNILQQIYNTNLKDIFAINILFITHSPFILSDIPKQNVLFLDVNKDTKKSEGKNFSRMNTFGANITDLLGDSFFIENGLIGDYAKEKIEEVIVWLNSILDIKDKIAQLNLENDSYKISKYKNRILLKLKKEVNERSKDFKKYYKVIQIIDEPFLKQKLEEMYFEATLEFPRKEILEKEIERMQKELYELNKNN